MTFVMPYLKSYFNTIKMEEKKKREYKSIKTDENGITGTFHFYGNAAKVVEETVKEVKENRGVKQYGKQRAIQLLLCEIYKLKHLNQALVS